MSRESDIAAVLPAVHRYLSDKFRSEYGTPRYMEVHDAYWNLLRDHSISDRVIRTFCTDVYWTGLKAPKTEEEIEHLLLGPKPARATIASDGRQLETMLSQAQDQHSVVLDKLKDL